MPTARHGGLSGKARKARYRNRAARLHARDMINEYFDPGAARSRSDRYVPIGGRSEFLPSVAHLERTGEGTRQLELPLTDKGNDYARPVRNADSGDRVIRFRRDEEQTRSFDPRSLRPGVGGFRRSRQEFTLRGFLAGCAMGGAAAALLLLVVRTTVG